MQAGPCNTASSREQVVRTLVGCGLIIVLALTIGGCARDGAPTDRSTETSEQRRGFGMGGVEQTIAIPASFVRNKPAPWDLSTPERAVRSYLDWISYAYRIGESDVATATQSPYQVVRTDAYIQANLQQERLLDQTLEDISLGKARIEETRALVPARERWSYRYVSIKEPGKTVDGPRTVSYETTYTLTKSEQGWVVHDIEVRRLSNGK